MNIDREGGIITVKLFNRRKDISEELESSYNKQKCEELRKIRVKMADEMGIPWTVRQEPCNFDGVCKGTCPTCYMEERALMDRLYELVKNKDNVFEDMGITKEDDFFGAFKGNTDTTKKEDDFLGTFKGNTDTTKKEDDLDGFFDPFDIIEGDIYYDSED